MLDAKKVREKGTWKAFTEATQHDFEITAEWEEEYNAGLVDRLFDQLRMLDEEWTPYPINRYEHSLQSG